MFAENKCNKHNFTEDCSPNAKYTEKHFVNSTGFFSFLWIFVIMVIVFVLVALCVCLREDKKQFQ